MALQCFILLVIFLTECLGHTEFIYTDKEEVKLFCDTNTWQISTESDSTIDMNCTVECVTVKAFSVNKTQKSCTNKDSDKDGEKCPLIARSGFFRCVTAMESGFLYPFKPTPKTVTSYIVATANEEMTTRSEERSTFNLTEGGDILLNCSFNLKEGYDNQKYVVYWIKITEENSNCVYSYDFDPYTGTTYNHQRKVHEELLYRLSNRTVDKNTHNIKISNVTEADAGRYVCALQVHKNDEKKVMWKIINNITLVHENKRSGNRIALVVLCATIPILLVLVLATVGIWKKTKTSLGSQAIELQRNQNGGDTEETADMECAPYAIGSGEEIRFKSKQDPLKQDGQEIHTEYHSVVKINDLYEPGQ